MAAPLQRLWSGIPLGLCKNCKAVIQSQKGYRLLYASSYSTITVSPGGSAPTTEAYKPRDFFRCNEDNPLNHTSNHEGQFYTIPVDQIATVTAGIYSRRWHRLIKPFGEAAVMVRKPATEIFSYLQQTNFDHPPIKYIMFGPRGSGKTMTMNHVIHYCLNAGWLIVQVPHANRFNVVNRSDYIESTSHEGLYEQPAFAVQLLKLMKTRNESSLTELLTHNKYVWSKREQTEAGEPLMAIIEQGINRPKNSTDALAVLFKELKLHSHSKKFKMLVAVRGVNGLFAEQTRIRKPGGYKIPVKELCLHMHYKNLLQGKWVSGAIVTSIDEHQVYGKPVDTYKPLALLGKEGFDLLDPFVPVFVGNYSEKEYESQMAYFMHKNWIQEERAKSEEGRKHIKVLSEMNPAEVDRIVAPL